MVVAGVAGLSLGSGLSYVLRKRFGWIDPVICGSGVLIAAPFVFRYDVNFKKIFWLSSL